MKRTNILIISAAVISIIAVGRLGYLFFGKELIAAMYSGKAPAILNSIIEAQEQFPLDHYYFTAEKWLGLISLIGIAISIILFLYWLIPPAILEAAYSGIIMIINKWSRNKLTFSLITAIIFLGLTLVVAGFILHFFPNSGDEYAYIFQAELLSHGRFWTEPHPHQEFFQCWFITAREGKLFSRVPPGWPLALAITKFIRIPMWLLNPILGSLSLLCVLALGRELFGFKVGAIAALTTGISSFFLFNSASYFAHTLCSLLLLFFALCAVRLVKEPRNHLAFLMGISWGWAFITRYFSAALCSFPIAIYLLINIKKYYRKLGWVFAGVGIFIVFTLLYNYGISGEFSLLPDHYAEPGGTLGFVRGHSVGMGIENTVKLLKEFMFWTPFTLLLLYIWCLFKHIGKNSPQFVKYIYLVVIVGHFLYWSTGGNRYGPRYYYEAYPFLVLSVAALLFEGIGKLQLKQAKLFIFYLFLLGEVSAPFQLLYHSRIENKVVEERIELYNLVEDRELVNSLIFLSSGTGILRPMAWHNLTRNDIDFSNSVLYVRNMGENNYLLMKYYPNRKYYLFSLNRNTGKGELEELYLHRTLSKEGGGKNNKE